MFLRAKSIIDNLGVVMAVKWPQDYDHRYDQEIHTLMDLSWYLLQYLSDDSMGASQKPGSSSYLFRKTENLVYKVIQDGMINTESDGTTPAQ